MKKDKESVGLLNKSVCAAKILQNLSGVWLGDGLALVDVNTFVDIGKHIFNYIVEAYAP